jgi:cob(I)alamin adenosyltransferase
MMRIYTRTGDAGETGLFGGQRVAKDSLRVEAYGTVDEVNALLGVTRACPGDEIVTDLLADIQADLFILGADLATPMEEGERVGARRVRRVEEAQVRRLEGEIDRLQAGLPPLDQFILPGGSERGALLHLARTVCRRAERCVVALTRAEAVSPEALRYLNRLSDLLFVLARTVNQQAGIPELPWSA